MFEDCFENLTKTLHNLKSVSIPIEADCKGYIDKQCPSEKCQFLFKVNEQDWNKISEDKSVWCPLCRHEDSPNKWFTIEQQKYAETEALFIAENMIHNAMRSDAIELNQRHNKHSFVSISMEVQGGHKRTHAIPAKAAEKMELEVLCEKCNARFSVIGSAFFCPACGHNSVKQTFRDSLRKIKAKINIDNINVVRQALIEAASKDEAELTCRSLKETCISDGVVAFQRLCEGLYEKFGKASPNVFQRLEDGSKCWIKAINKGYNDWLSNEELSKLKVLYQKRHILSHNEGIVDAQYIKKSGDTSYKEGQRIVVSVEDIDNLIEILEKLSKGIQEACSNT